MRLGATLVHLSAAPPYPVAEWARRLEGAGFESLWTPQVIGRGFLVPLHHPADLAHRVLSLRSVCGDRLSLGVSPGSTDVDYAAFDRDYTARFRTFDENLVRLRILLARGRDEKADLAPVLDGAGGTPLLLGSWGAKVERAAREFDGWLASAYRRTADQIIAAHERYRAAGGRRSVVCAIPLSGRDDLGPTGELLQRYADAGFDDAVVLIQPGGPDPEQVRALLP